MLGPTDYMQGVHKMVEKLCLRSMGISGVVISKLASSRFIVARTRN